MTETKFGQDEGKMVYFFLLSSLRKEHFEEVGIEDKGSYYYLTNEDKMRIIENLTAKQKAVIRRDYLDSQLQRTHLAATPSPPLCLILPKTYARPIGRHPKRI